mmetsp:Transcript_110764/g.357430  ORF Transcript_110764/g.357430 Transcript_110764/m.357430 type:complete len:347 (-) Transcript_110764:121-1161(-)
MRAQKDLQLDVDGMILNEKALLGATCGVAAFDTPSGWSRQTSPGGDFDAAAAEFGDESTSCFSPLSRTSCASISDVEAWCERDETVIFFDWDDTLCPSTHGRQNSGCEVADAEALKLHAEVVADLLRLASMLGHVRIVTMASKGWVEETTRRLMPSLEGLLEELDITVALAREDVPRSSMREAFAEAREPSQFLKTRAMKQVIVDFYRNGCRNDRRKRPRSWKNLLSVGDSEAERHALQDVILRRLQKDHSGRGKACRCKTLKLVDEPDLPTLTKELCRVAMLLHSLVFHDGDIHIDLDDCDIVDSKVLHDGDEDRERDRIYATGALRFRLDPWMGTGPPSRQPLR